MKKILFMFAIGISVGVSGSIIAYLIFQEQPQIEPPYLPPTVEKVEQVAKLITIEYYMADVVSYQNSRIWPFSDQKILVIVKAKIMAGFNLLHRINVTVVHEPDKDNPEITSRVRITLPPPQIIAIQPDYSYYDIQGNPPPDAHTYVLNLAKVSLWEAAKREGILEKAKQSVVQQMQHIFNNVDLEIYFHDEQELVNNEDN